MAYTVGAFALGLALTLVLAAFLTPRAWWRRPNLRALAILAAGTWGLGSLLLPMAPAPAMAATPAMAPAPAMAATTATAVAGRRYRVFEDLNLRNAGATSARRVGVVPPGTMVTATGAHAGDWWQVRATIKGKRVTGWVSSLWLRRADEVSAAPISRPK